MASDTNIKKPKSGKPPKGIKDRRRGPRRSIWFSRMARAIVLSNLLGLLILIVGALALNQFSNRLVAAKLDNLESKAELITNIIADNATGTAAFADLDELKARQIISRITLPEFSRARMFDRDGKVIADSTLMDTDVEVETLDPIVTDDMPPPPPPRLLDRAAAQVDEFFKNLPWMKERRARMKRNLQQDVRKALNDEIIKGEQYDDDTHIVAVSVPVKRVQDVLGVVTLESWDVDDILASERRALAPIIGLAFVMALLSSIALLLFVAIPVRRLARAAETVRRSGESAEAIPDLSRRRDEIGDLSVVLRDMTQGLYERIDTIANFAADVAHEIKNPLTSLRSATDTLRVAKTPEQRERLIAIIQNDVSRMDRLITDISKASRMDAALASEQAGPVQVEIFLTHIAEFYMQTRSGEGPDVIYTPTPQGEAELIVRALEEPLGQVLRNLVDNALTFSPHDGAIRIVSARGENGLEGKVIITVEDDGPGIPEDNIETIFDRFYTERPTGAVFGSHSGLGLAICRQIIEAHNGKIWAENRLGDSPADGAPTVIGARFVVMLPEHGYTPRKSGRRVQKPRKSADT